MVDTDLLNENDRPYEAGVPDVLPGTNLLIDWIRSEIVSAMPDIHRFRDEYLRCRRFFDGKHLTAEDKELLKGRPDNAFNTAQKFVRFVTGVERTAPEAVIFSPIDENDEKQQELGEFVTRAFDWALQKGRGNFERSTAFEDLIVGGMAWEDYYIDHGRDPRGLPAMARFSPLEALFPSTNRQNLEGARWRGRETFIDVQEALTRWPEDTEIIRLVQMSRGHDRHDRRYPQESGVTEFVKYPVETKPMNEIDLGGQNLRKLRITQFEWYDDEMGYYFFDPLEKNDAWLNASDFKKYRMKLRALLDEDIQDFIKQPSRSYKRVFLLNQRYQLGEVIKLKRFHLNCMTGSWDEEDRVWYGFFRILIDPSKYANKFFNQILEITGRSAKGGGFLYEKGAIHANQLDAFNNEYSVPGTSQEVQPGAIAGKKIMPKPGGELPPQIMGLMQFCVQMMADVTGISPDQFQAQGAHVPGVTLRQKGKAALVLLAKEFDALSRFREDEGLIVFDMLETLADDRLIRVGGHADGQVVRLMREPFVTEYELALDDTERDPNIRREYEDAVMKLAPTLVRMQMFLPELLDYMRLPFRFKRALKEAIRNAYIARQEAAKRGEPQGGRGQPVTPEERAAKVAETRAKAMAQLAKVERLKTQSKRDEVRTVIDTLVKAYELKMAGEQHGMETAHEALDIFQQATGIGGQSGSKPRKKSSAPKSKPSKSEEN